MEIAQAKNEITKLRTDLDLAECNYKEYYKLYNDANKKMYEYKKIKTDLSKPN